MATHPSTADQWDATAWLCQLVQATAETLPEPKPSKPRSLISPPKAEPPLASYRADLDIRCSGASSGISAGFGLPPR